MCHFNFIIPKLITRNKKFFQQNDSTKCLNCILTVPQLLAGRSSSSTIVLLVGCIACRHPVLSMQLGPETLNIRPICSCLYAGPPAAQLNYLDRVLRSATRLIGCIPKFSMRDVLRWLPARQRMNSGLLHWSSTACWTMLLSILLSSVAPH